MMVRDFSWALLQMKLGHKMCRTGWNGKGMYVAIRQVHDDYAFLSAPYLYMHTAQKDFVVWLASQSDILAEDWNYYE
jgi:hypothetical protein